MRVLEWVIKRCTGEAGVVETPIGRLPSPNDLRLDGIDVPADTLEALLEVQADAWQVELSEIKQYLNSYGERTPNRLVEECDRVSAALGQS